MGAQEDPRTPPPPPVERTISFRREVFPLLQSRCFKCHSGPNSTAGLRLDRRPELLGESSDRPAVVPGKSGESRLIQLVSGTADKGEIMPPKGARLTAGEVGILRAWID